MNWKKAIDSAMEAAVVPSFTLIGARLRARLYDWDPCASLEGKTVVITGATSGIGGAAGRRLASLGACLVVVGRDEERTETAAEEFGRVAGAGPTSAVIADLSDLDDLRRAGSEIADQHSEIHALVHNAGALFDERREVPNGTERSVELMVAAPFLLTSLLTDALAAGSPGRVVTMSSGGMYTTGLHVEDLQMSEEDYSGAQQYARAKRAQVVLTQMAAERFAPTEIVFHALHPGWADTPGVVDALPGFHRLIGPLLRTAEEGADTLVWLVAAPEAAASSGGFWHDRAERSTHKIPSTRSTDTPDRRAQLWRWCEEHTYVTCERNA